MERKHFSIGEALKWGFKTLFDQIMFFLVLGLVFLGLYLAVSGVSALILSLVAQRVLEDDPLILILAAVLIVALSVVFMGLFLGLIKIMLDMYDHGKAEIKTLFSQGHLVFRFVAASLLFGLLVGIGMAFFVIPGIYFLCRYFFFNYAMVDKNLGVLEAFQESSRLTEGARWQILGLSIISWFINMVPLLAFATLLAAVYAYRHQQENTLQLPIVSK